MTGPCISCHFFKFKESGYKSQRLLGRKKRTNIICSSVVAVNRLS